MTHAALHAVIMAAGKGTRIGAVDRPKVLFEVKGRPMLDYVFQTAKDVGVEKPVVVIGFCGDKIVSRFGDTCNYVIQHEQKGTAHAVMMAEPVLRHEQGITLILSGDQPFIKPSSIESLVRSVEHGATIALLTGIMESPAFDSLGRVLTDVHGNVTRIVEVKDATDDEKLCRRMGFGTYAVNNQWLWENLKRIPASPVTGEYYLTDIVRLATDEGRTVTAVDLTNEHEAIGINTLDHLKEAEAVVA